MATLMIACLLELGLVHLLGFLTSTYLVSINATHSQNQLLQLARISSSTGESGQHHFSSLTTIVMFCGLSALAL
jgi:hypothetical protein